MPTYNTPGTFVEEISTLPGSVAPVATAVPVFIGYTANHSSLETWNGGSPSTYASKPVKIGSLLEYENIFGAAETTKSVTVNLDMNGAIDATLGISGAFTQSQHVMYYSLQHYFANGGGPCYVISVRNQDFSSGPTRAQLTRGLAPLATLDEPTIIVYPELLNLSGGDYSTLVQETLVHCADMGDRFFIIDVQEAASTSAAATTFRTAVGEGNLKFGAAYYPHLVTTIPLVNTSEDQITISQPAIDRDGDDVADLSPADAGHANQLTLDVIRGILEAADENSLPAIPGDASPMDGVNNTRFDYSYAETSPSSLSDLQKWNLLKAEMAHLISDEFLKDMNSKISDKAVAAGHGILGPSSAMAGVYATVDRDRGVWKAPANVGLSMVTKPNVKISKTDLDGLNVDSTAGKSINAIRSFTGKGVLVWGARTLAGNDNEWRYVNVRRLFLMIEESIEKATSLMVFENNDAKTWKNVRVMIENFLTDLWKQGALAGTTPKDAFFVNAGLNSTMTATDILNGKLIVDVGVAAVRPAEFIVLRFSHKIQEN